MAREHPPFVSSEVETPDRAKARNPLTAARQALLGGPASRERLAEADAKTAGAERRRGLSTYIVLGVGMAFMIFRSDSSSFAWFLPILFVGVCIFFAAHRFFRSIGDFTADPSGLHTYSRGPYGDDENEYYDIEVAGIDGETADIPVEEARPPMVPDEDWNPPPGIWVKPRGDWGFTETIDGQLGGPFAVDVEESGVPLFDGRLGWRGRVRSAVHKYGYMEFIMRPRHVPFDGIVSIDVTNGGHSIYSGVADTRGLECDWL